MAGKVGRPRSNGPLCGAKTKTGHCGNPAGMGTPHKRVGSCWRHGGNSPTHIKHGERVMAEEAAARAVEEFGLEVVTTVEDALMGCLARANGMCIFYRAKVRKLSAEQMVYGTEKVTRTQRPANRIGDIKGTPFLVEDTQTVKTSVNIWVTQLEKAERHLFLVSAKVAELSIESRRVQIAKEEGQVIFEAMVELMKELGIPDDDPRLPDAVGRVVAAITA